jgi:hypothetical protein
VIILKEDLAERPPKNIDFLLKTRTYIKWSRDENRQARPGNEYVFSVSGEKKVKFPKHWKTVWFFANNENSKQLSQNNIVFLKDICMFASKANTQFLFAKIFVPILRQTDFYERLKAALSRQSDSFRYHKVVP